MVDLVETFYISQFSTSCLSARLHVLEYYNNRVNTIIIE